MKIRVYLKDPDNMPDAVLEAVQKDVRSIEALSPTERTQVAEDRAADIQTEIAHRYMQYSEYLMVEFDTDDWTARVVPNAEHKQ